MVFVFTFCNGIINLIKVTSQAFLWECHIVVLLWVLLTFVISEPLYQSSLNPIWATCWTKLSHTILKFNINFFNLFLWLGVWIIDYLSIYTSFIWTILSLQLLLLQGLLILPIIFIIRNSMLIDIIPLLAKKIDW